MSNIVKRLVEAEHSLATARLGDTETAADLSGGCLLVRTNKEFCMVNTFMDRRVKQIAQEYIAEYGTVDAAMTALVHGSEFTNDMIELVCDELDLMREGVPS